MISSRVFIGFIGSVVLSPLVKAAYDHGDDLRMFQAQTQYVERLATVVFPHVGKRRVFVRTMAMRRNHNADRRPFVTQDAAVAQLKKDFKAFKKTLAQLQEVDDELSGDKLFGVFLHGRVDKTILGEYFKEHPDEIEGFIRFGIANWKDMNLAVFYRQVSGLFYTVSAEPGQHQLISEIMLNLYYEQNARILWGKLAHSKRLARKDQEEQRKHFLFYILNMINIANSSIFDQKKKEAFKHEGRYSKYSAQESFKINIKTCFDSPDVTVLMPTFMNGDGVKFDLDTYLGNIYNNLKDNGMIGAVHNSYPVVPIQGAGKRKEDMKKLF